MKVLGEVGFGQTVSEIKKLRSKVSELQQIIDNSELGIGYIDCTYTEALELANNGELHAGYRYRINDYAPCVRESKLYKSLPSKTVKKMYIFLTALSDSEFDINCTVQLETEKSGTIEVNGKYILDNITNLPGKNEVQISWADSKTHKGCLIELNTLSGSLPFDFYNIGIRRLKTFDMTYPDNWASTNYGMVFRLDGKYFASGQMNSGKFGEYKSIDDLNVIDLGAGKYFASNEGIVFATERLVTSDAPNNPQVGENLSKYFIGNSIGLINGSADVLRTRMSNVYRSINGKYIYIPDLEKLTIGTNINTQLGTTGAYFADPNNPNKLITDSGQYMVSGAEFTPGQQVTALDINEIGRDNTTYYAETVYAVWDNSTKYAYIEFATSENRGDIVHFKDGGQSIVFYNGIWQKFDGKLTSTPPVVSSDGKYWVDCIDKFIPLTDEERADIRFIFGHSPSSSMDENYGYRYDEYNYLVAPEEVTFEDVFTIVHNVIRSTNTPNPFYIIPVYEFERVDDRLKYGVDVPYADADISRVPNLSTTEGLDEYGRWKRKYDLYLPLTISDSDVKWTKCSDSLRDMVGIELKTNTIYQPASEQCEVKLKNGTIIPAYRVPFAIKLLEWLGAENITNLSLLNFDYGNYVIDNIVTKDNIHANLDRNVEWDVKVSITRPKNDDNPYGFFEDDSTTIVDSLPVDFDKYSRAHLFLSIDCYDVTKKSDPGYKPINFSTDIDFEIWKPSKY